MPWDNPLTCLEVEEIPDWSTTSDEKDAFEETCNSYEVAPEEEFQESVNVVGWPVAPFAGEESDGGSGTCGTGRFVVNREVDDHSVGTSVITALTRQ